MIDSHDNNRIFGLDILRACAIISVVSTHGGFLVRDTFLENFPFLVFLDGVDLFFVLSGFLIGTILLKEINKEGSLDIFKLANFWKRRWFRTVPNYYLILLLNFIWVKFHFIYGSVDSFNWKFIFFLHNFSSSFSGFGESWSLSVEEWFYIFAPLILFVLVKLMKQKAAFICTALVLIVFSIVVRCIKADPNVDWFWIDSEIRKVVITRFDAIAYGLVAAWCAFYYLDFWRKFRIPFLCLGLIVHFVIVNFDFNGNYIYTQIIGACLVPISAMLFLPMAHSIKTCRGIIAKSITFISKISYSMYLINLGIVADVMKMHFPVKNTTDGLLKYFLYWTIIIVVSAIIYKFYEKPFMNLRNKNFIKFQKKESQIIT